MKFKDVAVGGYFKHAELEELMVKTGLDSAAAEHDSEIFLMDLEDEVKPEDPDNYDVTLTVTVANRTALYDAAVKRLIEEGVDPEDAANTCAPDGFIDVGVCLRMIVDPSSIDGCEIHDSTADRVY